MAMRRIQVMIPEEQYAWLRRRARAEGKSVGQLVREAIERLGGHAGVGELPPLEEDPIWEIVGAFEGPSPYDASVRHDEILYGNGNRGCRGTLSPCRGEVGGVPPQKQNWGRVATS